MQTDWGDTRLNNYILEHGYRWLRGMPGHSHFWSPPVFFPAPNTAGYSDVLLGVALPYWTWRALGFEPDTAFQLWMLAIAALNFASGFVLLSRGFRCRPLGSAVGALLFSFAAMRTAQLMHPQLLAHFYIAIAIFALLRLFGSEPARLTAWVAVLAGACVAQLYAGYYYGWFLGLAMLLASLWALALPGTRQGFIATVKANAAALVACAAVSALLLAPMAIHYLRASRDVGLRSFTVVETMLPRVQSWVYLGPESWLYASLAHDPLFLAIPMEHEQRIGLGIATAIFAALGLWMGRARRGVQLLTFVALTIAVLATEWPGGITLWRSVYILIPGAGAIRAVSRIGVVMLVPASLGIALLVDSVSGALVHAKSRIMAFVAAMSLAAVVTMVVAEQSEAPRSYDKGESRVRVARIVGQLSATCVAFLYTTPDGPDDPWWFHADAMWASMESGVPTLNGYSGNKPPGWPFYEIKVSTPQQDSAIDKWLMRWAARWKLDPTRICRVRAPPS